MLEFTTRRPASLSSSAIRRSRKRAFNNNPNAFGAITNAILSLAAGTAADFIVMGGYGHPRIREFVFGGTTRGMLRSMTVPTLMSH